MTKAQGYNTHTLIKRESSFGVSAGGNFVKLAANANSLGKKRGLLDDPLAGQGRDPLKVFNDVNDVSGDLQLPVDLRYIGYFLTGLLGNPTTGGTGPYTHTFKSGGLTLPSYSIETGHKGPTVYELNLGCMVDAMNFKLPTGGGPAEVTAKIVGQNNTKYAATQGGTPTTQTLTRFSNFQGVLKQGGSALGNITDFNFTYSNKLMADRVINTTGDIGAIEPGQASLAGGFTSRFADDDLMDLAIAGTAVDMDLIFTIDADNKLTLTLHELYLEHPSNPIPGPGGYSQGFSFKGVYNVSNTAMFKAVLINDLAGTVYTT